MRALSIPVFALATLIAVGPGLAGADEAAPLAAAEQCRVDAIPAHTKVETRTVAVPAVRECKRIPRYETVRVPVYELRRVPVHETVQRPVYESREIPVYRTERVPIWGEKEVTVYKEVRTPVTIEVWNPFQCDDEVIELWDKCEEVPCGTRTVPAIVDYETRRIQCGTRTERIQTGSTAEEVLVGYRCERVKTGETERRHLVGYDTKWVVVEPAREEVVTEVIEMPCEPVTVVPDGTRAESPLPNTKRVLTEAQFDKAVAAASANSAGA